MHKKAQITDEIQDAIGMSRRYKVSLRTIANWRNRKVIPFIRVGHVIRYRVSDTDRALEKFTIK